MDLVYIPEILIHGSFRNPAARDYEMPWNENYFTQNKKYAPQPKLTAEQRHHQMKMLQAKPPAKKVKCDLCKEAKRRSLATYIRGKSRNSSCGNICEEQEEEEEEIEESQQQQQNEQQKTQLAAKDAQSAKCAKQKA
ncbi:hypothetical protein TKK_0017920 [Trichogramma kaykai]